VNARAIALSSSQASANFSTPSDCLTGPMERSRIHLISGDRAPPTLPSTSSETPQRWAASVRRPSAASAQRACLFRATLSSISCRRPPKPSCPERSRLPPSFRRTRHAPAHCHAAHSAGNHNDSNERRRQRCDIGDRAGGNRGRAPTCPGGRSCETGRRSASGRCAGPGRSW
jgi:hypothetical protein